MQRVRTAALAAFVASPVMIAQADPVPLNVTTGNSFTQHWYLSNPESPLGDFDAIAIEFVSQTTAPGGSSTESGFKGFSISSGSGSWSTMGGGTQAWFAGGSSEDFALPHLTFHGETNEYVKWNIWYYLGGEALGGYQYSGYGSFASFSFNDLPASAAPLLIPLPNGVALGSVGLLGLGAALAVKRRR
jgi:hypothetical protein